MDVSAQINDSGCVMRLLSKPGSASHPATRLATEYQEAVGSVTVTRSVESASDADFAARLPSWSNVLVLNTDLPIFPGGGAVEFLTMKNLAARTVAVGLVSMAHTRDDLESLSGARGGRRRLYLWAEPLAGRRAPLPRSHGL